MDQDEVFGRLKLLTEACRLANEYDVIPEKEVKRHPKFEEFEGYSYDDMVSTLLSYIESNIG